MSLHVSTSSTPDSVLITLLRGIADKHGLDMEISACRTYDGGVDIRCSVRPVCTLINGVLIFRNSCDNIIPRVLLSVSVCAPNFEDVVVPFLKSILSYD